MVTPNDSANATSLDGSTTSATLELFRAALGPLNTDYYLKTFTRFDAADRAGPSWNWAACLCTLNWMALRQLWGAALGYTGALIAAVLLLFGIGRLVFQLSFEMQIGLLAGIGVLAFALPGVFGNALLYADSRKKMERALAANATLDDACAMLKRQAPSRQRLIGLLIGNGLLLAALVAGYAAFPDGSVVGAGTQGSTQARNMSVGKTQDLAPLPNPTAAPASAAASSAAAASPVTAASAAATSAAPAATGSAAVTAVTPPLAPSSAASPPAAPASAPGTAAAPIAAATSAPQVAISAPTAPPPSPAAKISQPKTKAVADKATTRAEKAKAAKAQAKAASSAAKPSAPKPPAPQPSVAQENREVRFLINVGLFADENNARNAYTKLSDAGLNVLSNDITTKNGKRTRVRVGPFATQAEADRAAEKIRSLRLDAIVVPQ